MAYCGDSDVGDMVVFQVAPSKGDGEEKDEESGDGDVREASEKRVVSGGALHCFDWVWREGGWNALWVVGGLEW